MHRSVRIIFIFFFFILSPAAFALDLNDVKIVDLSYAYDSRTIYWPTSQKFKMERVFAGRTKEGYHYEANNICTAEHGGTHIDAPLHFYKGRWAVDRIPLKKLIGKAIVVDVRPRAAKNPDYQVTVQDFVDWEEAHGPIPNGAIVLIRTGYGRRWPNPVKYLGTDERGPTAVRQLHFPGLKPYAAKWLTTKRNVNAVGIDTASIDYGQSRLFESHVTLFRKNIPVFENLANLDELPVKGFSVVALPMKIGGGSGGPLRIVALVSE